MVVEALEQLTIGRIPQSHQARIARGENFAIRAKGHTVYPVQGYCRVAERSEKLSAGHIPQPHCRIRTARSESFAIRAEGHAMYRIGMAPERMEQLTARCIPQLHGT